MVFFFCFQADLFAETEEAFIRTLSMCAQPTYYLANQFLQKSGEICDCMFYLHAGMLEVCSFTFFHPVKCKILIYRKLINLENFASLAA